MIYIGNRRYKFRNMIMFHMIADNLDELHHMADLIGLSRKYFQNKRIPHYDVCKSMKEKVLLNGGIEVSEKELIKIWKK